MPETNLFDYDNEQPQGRQRVRPSTRPSSRTRPPRTWIPGTAGQSVFADGVAAVASPATRQQTRAFFLYVMTARRFAPVTLAGEDVDEASALGIADSFVPISSLFIRRYFRDAEWEFLLDAGFIEVKEHSIARGLCREYRVPLDVRRRYAEAGLTPDTATTRFRLYNVVEGKPTKRRSKSVRTGRGNNALPRPIRRAMDAVGPAVINLPAIWRHVAEMKAIADATPMGPDWATANGRYVNDLLCAQAVHAQSARPLDKDAPDGLWIYEPAMTAQAFGRLGQVDGGLQSCTREMKVAAYSGVPDFHNYDLRASQAMILLVLLAEAGIDGSWLERYAVEGKASAAAHVGLPVDTWKKALYAVLMGASVPSEDQARLLPLSREVGVMTASQGRARRARKLYSFAFSRGTVTESILGAVGPDEFVATYKRFLDYTAGLRIALKEWYGWLEREFVRARGRVSNLDGLTYITNAVGSKVAVEDLGRSRTQRRGRLVAFVLQGREAAFVHALAASSKDFGFVVLSHEHDGLAVQGEIRAEAVARAAAEADLPLGRLILEEKSFL